MPLPPFLRKAIHRLPAPLRRALRRANSVRVVRGFQPADWEYHALAASTLRPGDCAVDAGANIGYVTKLLALLVGPSGRVHAFEPVAETHGIHAHGMAALGLNQVLSHQAGVSDQPGDARMTVPEYANGGRNFYESHVTRDGGGESVHLVTLDQTLADESRPVRFIKIDVEGHELEAIRGARAVIQRHRPTLLIEVQGDPAAADGNAAALFHLLDTWGYTAHLWRGGVCVPWRAGQTSVDYIFLPRPEAPSP